MTALSRLSPLIAAVAVSGLLVAGPAYAQTPPDCTGANATKPECTVQVDPNKAPGSPPSTSPTSKTTTSTPTSPKPPPGQGGYGPPPGGGRGPGGYEPGGGRGPNGPGGRGPDGHGGRPGGDDRPHPPRPGRPPGDRDCADFPTQDAAQDYFESIGGSKDNDADRLDANHNGTACEDFFDDGDDQGAAVSTTGDDGSSAKTSGSQVQDVPEGSAQTGGA